jgi:hypothetical protein
MQTRTLEMTDVARAQREAFLAGCAYGREVDSAVAWLFEAHARYQRHPVSTPWADQPTVASDDELLLETAGRFDD